MKMTAPFFVLTIGTVLYSIALFYAEGILQNKLVI